MRDGLQLFNIDYNVLDDEKIKNKIKAIKLVIKNSFGGNKTYINQIMFYENTLQEINSYETIQSNNTFKQEMNSQQEINNSNISVEENINNDANTDINANNNIRKIKNNKNTDKKNKNNIINGNKIKKHNIIDFISETNSKASDRNFINKEKEKEKTNQKEKEEDIKIEENNIIYNGNTNKNNDNNEEENKILTTSEGFQNSYMDNLEIKSCSRKNEDEFFNQSNNSQNTKNKNINYNNNKKVQKLEKILKQRILKNNFNNQNRTQEYNMNNFPNFTPIVKNNNNYEYNTNMKKMNNNQSNESEREMEMDMESNNYDNEENNMKSNTIQKYFQINANTPGRYPLNGYDYLINKKRPNTPKTNEIYLNQNQKKLKNKTLQNFAKNDLNKTDINNNKDYETLEHQLNDMEQHLQKMALNSDMLVPNYNNNNISRSNRTQSYFNNNDINNIQNKRQINNNNSVISNTTSYMNEEKNIINNMNNINNNNYFTNYKNNNNESQYGNNTYNRERDETQEINERIDNLEKNIFEIKNELNNISSGIKLFLDKDYFLYNFKDSIKQLCYDFFSEKIENNENNDNNENINQTRNENNTNEVAYATSKNTPTPASKCGKNQHFSVLITSFKAACSACFTGAVSGTRESGTELGVMSTATAFTARRLSPFFARRNPV